ncbi:MAG: hypothetical protein KGL39_23085 [Patescibacteria group bacterium]|nr:hypothetical protein [Patescibacteria group bacterium]
MSEISVKPWFGGSEVSLLSLEGTDQIAYSWTSISGIPDEPKTIDHLMVWHHCDKRVWRGDPSKNQSLIDGYVGWHPAGVGAHTLVAVEPLHIEPSVLWTSCCGTHGFIRDGRWIPA